MPAAEARRQALIEFGGVDAAREQCVRQGPGWWLGTVWQDFDTPCANSGTPVVLGGDYHDTGDGNRLNTMVFTLVNAVLYKPVPVPEATGWSASTTTLLPRVTGVGPFRIRIFRITARRRRRLNRSRPPAMKAAY